jgi:hypothetical protein
MVPGGIECVSQQGAVMWILILFTMVHPTGEPGVYEWTRTRKAELISAELCVAIAAMKNADTPFTHDNMPYYACEYESD